MTHAPQQWCTRSTALSSACLATGGHRGHTGGHNLCFCTQNPNPPPQVALYDTPGVTSAVRNREHGARVQGAWQVAQHCGVVLFLVDAARQVRLNAKCQPAGAGPCQATSTGSVFADVAITRSKRTALAGGAVRCMRRIAREVHTECRPTCMGPHPGFRASSPCSRQCSRVACLRPCGLLAAPHDAASTYGSAGERGSIALSPPLTTCIQDDDTCACRSTSPTRA